MIVKHSNKLLYSPQYLKDREVCWTKKLQEYKEKNIPLWNGSVYYLDQFKNNELVIGLCEYKDLVFLDEKSIQNIQEEYGMDFNFRYINVQIFLKDTQGLFLFGVKHWDDCTEAISVGGTLRLEDGEEIKSFDDIITYALKEVSIETKIMLENDKLQFCDVIVNHNICTFLFEYHMESLNANMLHVGEFDGGIIVTIKDLLHANELTLNKRLESLRDYLQKHE